jgi:hypothetical protein
MIDLTREEAEKLLHRLRSERATGQHPALYEVVIELLKAAEFKEPDLADDL